MSVAAIKISNQTGVRVVRIPLGPPGAPGASGNSQPTIYFAYGDASPLTIYTAPENQLIKQITLIVLTAFNGSAPTVSIGTTASPALLMATAENNLAVIGSFETSPNETISAGTQIKVFITPGAGASAGQCGVLIEYAAAA